MIMLEVIVNGWVVRHQEGYVSVEGDRVTVSDTAEQLGRGKSPRETIHSLTDTIRARGESFTATDDCIEQADDVRERPEFTVLGVVEIWRRIVVEPKEAVPPPQ